MNQLLGKRGQALVGTRLRHPPVHWATTVSFFPRSFPPLSTPSLPWASCSGWEGWTLGRLGLQKLRPPAQRLAGPAEESTSTGVGVGVHVLRADKGKPKFLFLAPLASCPWNVGCPQTEQSTCQAASNIQCNQDKFYDMKASPRGQGPMVLLTPWERGLEHHSRYQREPRTHTGNVALGSGHFMLHGVLPV